MKTHVRQSLVIKIITACLLLLLLLLINGVNNKSLAPSQMLNTISPRVSLGLPVRLKISAINVDADIQYVGTTPKGAMEVPNNAVDVGWFGLGVRPGEKGNAVIAGHFNGRDSEAGVFFNLYKLKKGDKIYVEDNRGASIAFLVRESRIFDPGYVGEIFSSSDSAHLNLITCDGVWDGAKKSYSKRLVVFADLSN